MSYILEALKKAQAERQLGNAPDIHTPAPVQVPAAAATANRKPLLIGLGAGAVAAALVMGIVWRSKTPGGEPAVLAQATTPAANMAMQGAAPPAAMAPAPAPAVVVTDAPPVADTPVTQTAPPRASQMNGAAAMTPPAATPLAAAVAPPPAAARPAVPAAPAPSMAPPRVAATPPAPAAARDAVPEAAPEAVYLPAPARAPEPAAAVRAPDQNAEETLRTLQQLPEAIQREVPKVAVGGYIYSPNPADRLLLIDKTLRREGEEVAPGLVLERLMPKYAVMNYRGTRYRVGY